MTVLQETGKGLTLGISETFLWLAMISHKVCQNKQLAAKQTVTHRKQHPEKWDSKRMEESQERQSISTTICLMHVKYLLQYLSFTSVEKLKGPVVNCPVENSATMKKALLTTNTALALCPAGICMNQVLLKCSSSLAMFPHASVFYPRCVCTSASLRLPAIPEGQADQTRVPDTLFPRGLSCCRHRLPHSDLSHIHR